MRDDLSCLLREEDDERGGRVHGRRCYPGKVALEAEEGNSEGGGAREGDEDGTARVGMRGGQGFSADGTGERRCCLANIVGEAGGSRARVPGGSGRERDKRRNS